MGLFDSFKKSEEQKSVVTTPVVETGNNIEYTPTNGLLDLTKNSILDLTKYSDSLKNVKLAAGWDVNSSGGNNYDLDICAFLINKDGKAVTKVYYGDKNSKGIYLDGDNQTGAGDGDDENIFINLNKIPENITKIVFAVVIYSAKNRGQSFGKVKNAYVRLVDEDARGEEICKYSLSEDGKDNTAVTFAELYKNGNGWSFKAVGEYSKDDIDSLYSKYK